MIISLIITVVILLCSFVLFLFLHYYAYNDYSIINIDFTREAN